MKDTNHYLRPLRFIPIIIPYPYLGFCTECNGTGSRQRFFW